MTVGLRGLRRWLRDVVMQNSEESLEKVVSAYLVLDLVLLRG